MLPRKPRGLVGDAHVGDSFVPRYVIGPVGNRLAHTLGRKIVDVDLLRIARQLPPTPAMLERSDQFLLLRVHTDDRIMVAAERRACSLRYRNCLSRSGCWVPSIVFTFVCNE